MTQWQPQAYTYLLNHNYDAAIDIYLQSIEQQPQIISHYFYLGLLQLLQGKETEAQFTWMTCISEEVDTEQIDQWTNELVGILYTEVQRQITIPDYQTAWLISQHIHEIDPYNFDNSLTLVWLLIQVENLDHDSEIFNELIHNLQELGNDPKIPKVLPFDLSLLWRLLKSLTKYPPYPLLIEFTEVCIPFIQDTETLLYVLISAAIYLSYYDQRTDLGIQLLEICLRVAPEEIEVYEHLSGLYQKVDQYDQAVTAAQKACQLSVRTIDRFFAHGFLLKAMLSQGSLTEQVMAIFATQQSLLTDLIAEQPRELLPALVSRLFTSNYFAPYLRDAAKLNRTLQNQIAQLCQANTPVNLDERMQQFRQRELGRNNSSVRKLRIGYISHCMVSHSVGWLARWLIRHHDRQKFELYGYFQVYRQYPDPLQAWYEQQMDHVYRGGLDSSGKEHEMADRIYADQIDILVDLDSITLDNTCGVMALKPAPVQVTWLGSDASGIPAIDYFIADPYVLPDHAEEYYAEKIWRLPETYIAVDGFEVDVPSLRRDQLDIPADAIVFLSAQRGYKRHIDTMRLQMQILKSVPNSYFLIKGLGDQDSIRSLFEQTAKLEGVDPKCLRFLDITETEAIHRANLGLADIVLDTYPYNGATTTLEALWMGVPLVTRVGEQFSARNSYGMMVNAGISEGIAWTDAEYVEWGIKLGKDAQLRQDISIKLKASRQTAPLWNGKKFTLEMEKAYEQMWQDFILD